MKALVILSHKLNDNQKEELKSRFGIMEIVYLPEELQNIWTNIDPYGGLKVEKLQKIIHWIRQESNQDVYVIVQGEFGATFYVVDFCLKNGFQAIYATSERQVREEVIEQETRTIRVFQHINFRPYLSWKE